MALGDPVGDAYIEVGAEDNTAADLLKIQSKLKAQMRKAAIAAGQELANALEQAGDEAGDRMLHELEKDARKIEKILDHLAEDRKMTITADTFVADAAARIAYAARDRIVNLWLNVRGNAAAQISAILKGLSGASALQAWTDSFINFTASLPQTILRIGMLSSAIAALVLPLLNVLTTIGPLGASLGQIFPLILAGPAAFGAMAASIYVLVAAFSGLENSVSTSGQRAFEVIQGLKDQFSELKQVVQGNFWDGFIGPFENMMATLMPQLQSGLAGLGTSMGNAFGKVADAISQALGTSGLENFFTNINAGLDAAAPGLAAFASGFVTIMEKGSTLFPAFGEWVTKIGEAFNQWASTADIAGLIENAAVQLGHLWDVGTEAWRVVSALFQSMDIGQSTGLESLAATLSNIADILEGDAFQTAMGTIFQGAADGASQLADALIPIGNALGDMAPTIAYVLSSLGGTAATLFTEIAEALAAPVAQGGIRDAMDAIASVIEGIDWGGFSSIIGGIGSLFTALAPTVVALVNGFLPIVDAVLPAFEVLAEQLGAILPPLLDALLPLVEILAEAFSEAFVVLGPAITELVVALGPLLEVLGVLLPPIIAAAAQIIAALAEALSEGGAKGEALSQAVEVMGAIVTTVFEVLANVVSAAIFLILGTMDILLALIRGDWEAVWTKGVELVRNIFQAFGLDIDKIVKDVTSWISQLLADFQRIFQGIATQVSETISDVLQWFNDLPGAIGRLVSDAGSWLYNTGRDIIDGLWNGLKSMWDGLVGWIEDSFGGVIDTVNSILQINSPSKVFIGIGKSMTEGLIDGLDGMEDAANKAMEDAMKPITSTQNFTMTGLTPTTGAGNTSSIDNSSTKTTTIAEGAFQVAGDDPRGTALEILDLIIEEANL